jgi:hypothetical protein
VPHQSPLTMGAAGHQGLAPAPTLNSAWVLKRSQGCLALSSLSWTIARVRSRIGWVKEGDVNTALFHAHASYRKSKNFIATVVSSDGQILTTHEDKAAAFLDFYNGLLGAC